MSGHKSVLADSQQDRKTASRKDSETHRQFKQLVAELEVLLRDFHDAGSRAPMSTLKLANWAGDMLKLYQAEEQRLEEDLHTFERRYGRVIGDLTKILRELLDLPENQALLKKYRCYSLRDEMSNGTNSAKPPTHQAFSISTASRPSPQAAAPPMVGTSSAPDETDQPLHVSHRHGKNTAYRYSIRLLGGFSLQHSDGTPIMPPAGKAGQILKYLIVHRNLRILRDVLMDRFWQRHDPDSARNNLNVAIYGLRKAMKQEGVSDPCIIFRDGGYQIDPDVPIWVDVDAFNACIGRARKLVLNHEYEAAYQEYERADGFYCGEFLPDDLYEEWTIPIRQDLTEKYVSMCRYMADYLLKTRNYNAALAMTRRLLQIEPCDEAVHRQIMTIHAESEQRHLAVRQYNLCKALLAKELGIEPEEKTKRLLKKIRTGK